mmetsp:Transcript_109956/g.354616  ORF Transcript_109956/g.354616 Transcript_109956/m.354616 type:complete len:143 (+) Transcript_109956:371-799(+)
MCIVMQTCMRRVLASSRVLACCGGLFGTATTAMPAGARPLREQSSHGNMAAERWLPMKMADTVSEPHMAQSAIQRDYEQIMESIAEQHVVSIDDQKALARKAKRRVRRSTASTNEQVGGEAPDQQSSTRAAVAQASWGWRRA